MGQDVSVLSRLQLEGGAHTAWAEAVEGAARADLPDVVFYTGCNVLKTPHIALLCLDIMDEIGTDYQVMGGPTPLLRLGQLRAGDTDTSGRFAANTINKLSQSKTGQVLAWCPSCVVQFGETDAADVRARDRREAVRHDAVHALPARQARPVAAAFLKTASR